MSEQDDYIDQSRRALRIALGQQGLPWVEPVLLRAAANIVWRCGDVVAKVFKDGSNAHRVAASVDVAGALATAGAPVLPPLGQALQTPYGWVSLWPYVAESRDLSWQELGQTIGALHRTHIAVPVVSWSPEIGTRWATESYREIGGDAGLADALDAFALDLSAAIKAADMGPECIIQGDVSPYNVVISDGQPLLIDMDWVAFGPAVIDSSVARVYQGAGRLDATQVADFEASLDLGGPQALVMAMRFHQFSELIFELAMACQRGQDTSWVREQLARLTVD